MACIAKRRGRYVLDYYDNQGERIRKTLKKGTTLKKAKEKLEWQAVTNLEKLVEIMVESDLQKVLTKGY